jgi:TonB family protein
MSALASLYTTLLRPAAQRRYDKAESLWKQVWDVQRRTLGDDAAGTLDTMRSLASLYDFQRRHEEARALWTRVISSLNRTVGDENPLTLMTKVSLVKTYDELGMSEQASTLERELQATADRLESRNDPLARHFQSILEQNGPAQPGRASRTATETRAQLSDFDGDTCRCVEAVIISQTRGYDFGRYLNQALSPIRRRWNALVSDIRVSNPGGRVIVSFDVLQNGTVQELRLVSSSGMEELDQAATSSVMSSGPFPMLPPDSKIDHLEMQLTAVYLRNRIIRISGRVVVEDKPNAPIPPFRMMFSGSSLGRMIQESPNIEADGTFRTQLPPGEYRINASMIPRAYYLKSLVAGSTDLVKSPLKLNDDVNAPEIVATFGILP